MTLTLTPSALVSKLAPIAGSAVVMIAPSSVSMKNAAATVSAMHRDFLSSILCSFLLGGSEQATTSLSRLPFFCGDGVSSEGEL